MKVLLLAGGSSIHTVRWLNGLVHAGLDVALATQHPPLEGISPAVRIHALPFEGQLGYFRNVTAFRKVLGDEKPDIVNAHYASGYGTTARLAGFEPTLLSVWGADVYDFPGKSPLHRWWLKGNLRAAAGIASTSVAMAVQTRVVEPALGDIVITPFGVETDRFSPAPRGASDETIVIGTVKALTEKYGIDTMLRSIALLLETLRREDHPAAELVRVRIVGEGAQRTELAALADTLGLGPITTFTGPVPHDLVPDELRKIDVYVALSRLDSESFGVAIIEAGACGVPVIVSNVGGLPEVVDAEVTGIVVPKDDPKAAAGALHRLIVDPNLRRRMGDAGRVRVRNEYEWRHNVSQMISGYQALLAGRKTGAPKRA
jgi:glycosyltransferase involved in cell wall biosynthesis